ncbi:MAG: TetR/AcrR family transcriptional regulator [Deltaproteobacteria bacterium]|nr:TetR/AcrR family transcriptional regulator [Deltaproteobacteria bacterium]
MVSKSRNHEKFHRILEAAVRVFAEQGFHQATIAQIARQAGVADGTIYLYFKNKDDILVHIFNERTRSVFNRFREAVKEADGAVGKLKALVSSHLAEFQADVHMAAVYQVWTHQFQRVAEPQIKEMSKMYLDIVSEIVELGQQEGTLRKDLYLGLVKRFIIGAIDEVINTWLHAGGRYDLSTMADPLVDLFIRGIGTDTDAVSISGPASGAGG